LKTRANKNKNKSRRRKPARAEDARLLSYPFPHKMWTVLRCYTVNGLIDAVFSINSKVYRPSSYFDIDPDVGGPSYGGYATFAAMYGRYRVLYYDYEIKWCNLQSDGVVVGCYPIASTSTPSESIANANPETAEENSMGKTHLLGPVSAEPTFVMKGRVDAETLWGTHEVATDALWAADIGTSPTQNSWLMLTAERINGTSLALGAQYALTLTAHGYWEELIPKTG
jgi:hypothetical protein